jgi:hypothetical protein
MKLNKETIDIMKNFTNVSSSLIVNPGNKIVSLANDESVFAVAEVDSNFEKQLRIFDLPSFLQILSLFDGPELSWQGENDSDVVVADTENRYIFRQADANVIKHTEHTEIPMESTLEFGLSWEQINRVLRAASALVLDTVCFYSKDGSLYFGVFDKKQAATGNFSVKIASDVTGLDFQLFVNIEKLKLMQDDYRVHLSADRLLLRFETVNRDVTYWTTAESDSHFRTVEAAA